MKKIVLKAIRFYQKYPNHFLKLFFGYHNSCRFTPSCSNYLFDAVSHYGTIKGFILGAKRILACHPFSRGDFNNV